MYHFAADICKRTETGESLKNILYSPENSQFHDNIPAVRSLVDTALRNRVSIDNLISQTKLNEEIVFNEIWIARVLVAEIIFGKKSFHCTDAITKKVYKYKDELKSLSEGAKRIERAFIPRYCRINTLNCTKYEFYKTMSSHFKLVEVGNKNEISYEDFLNFLKKMKKTDYVQDYHMSDLYIFHPKANLTVTPLYVANKIILQDKASCLVAPLLAPTPSSLIIDMCAAPGYKTQHLSSITGNSGHILAVDICKDRHQVLANTRINYDLSNVITLNADVLHLSESGTKYVEYILLDAPCSGSGIVQNFDYGTDNRSNEKRLKSLHNLQAYLLRVALTQYPSARRIVYSTCSLNEEENEAVIDELLDLAETNKFTLVNLKNHYQDFTIGIEKYKCGRRTIRLIPEQSFTNGFFIALFERTNPPNPYPRSEFYKNMNSILENIIVKKKRKVDEAELNDTDGNVKRKDISKEVLSKPEEETNGENVHNKSSDEKNHKQKKSSVSPEKDKKVVQLKEETKETGTKKMKKLNNVRVFSNSDEDVKGTSSTSQPVVVKENYIRVLRSPELKDPVLNLKDQHDDEEEEDSDENEENGDLSHHDSDENVEKNNRNQEIVLLNNRNKLEIKNESNSDDSEESESNSDDSEQQIESNYEHKIKRVVTKDESGNNSSYEDSSEKDDNYDNNRSSYKNNNFSAFNNKLWYNGGRRNYEKSSYDCYTNQGRGKGGRGGNFRASRSYNSNFRGRGRGRYQTNRNNGSPSWSQKYDKHY